MKKFPLLRGYIEGCQIAVYCPYCIRWHRHGAGEEERRGLATHRVAHCQNEKSPFYNGGYFVQTFRKYEIKEISK